MIEQIAAFARPLLDFPMIRRTRRNHALEHATIHILSGRLKKARLSGRSSDSGFIIIGDVPTDSVESAVHEALSRLQKGEHNLALHPNCGTNLVTTGFMTTLSGLIGLRGSSKPLTLDRISWTMILMMLAVLFSQPLGMTFQKHFTTEGDPGDLEFISINRREVRWFFSGQPVVVHSIVTRQS